MYKEASTLLQGHQPGTEPGEHCRGGEDGQQTGGGRRDGQEGCGGCSGNWEPDGPGPRGPEGAEVCARPPGGRRGLSELAAQEGHGQPCVLESPC